MKKLSFPNDSSLQHCTALITMKKCMQLEMIFHPTEIWDMRKGKNTIKIKIVIPSKDFSAYYRVSIFVSLEHRDGFLYLKSETINGIK